MTALLASSNYTFSWFAVPVLAAGLLNWMLGFGTLVRERASRPSLTLLGMTLAIGLWLVGLAGAYSTTDSGVALIWIKASMVGTVFVPVCAFTHAAMGSARLHLVRLLAIAGCAFSSVLAALGLTTDTVLNHVHQYWWGYYPVYGPLGPVLIVYYGMFFVAGGVLYRLGQQTKSATHRTRMKIRLAALLMAAPATLDFLPTLHIAVYPVGYAFILGYIALSTYIVWRYRLVDITPALAARQIIDTMAEGLLVFDRDGAVRVANGAAELYAGQTKSLTGISCDDLDRYWVSGSLSPLLEPDLCPTTELAYRRRGGAETGALVVSSSKLRDARGEWVGVVCIMHDITDRQRSEAALRTSEALYRALVETSPDGVIVTDQLGQVIMTNGRAAELTGLETGDGIGRSALEFIAPDERNRLQESIRDATGTVVTRDAEYTLVKADGSTAPVELSISRISGAGDDFRIMAMVRDISERKRNEEKIRYLAFHDSLTGAATRAVLLDRMGEALARGMRSSAIVALIFVDLDGFKRINDTHGHEAGDEVLRRAGAILQGVLRESDTLARVGGDEFVLLLPDLKHRDAALVVAQRILIAMREAAADAALSGLSASLGIAAFPRDGADPEALLHHADAAMYEAKKQGGRRFAVWSSPERSVA